MGLQPVDPATPIVNSGDYVLCWYCLVSLCVHWSQVLRADVIPFFLRMNGVLEENVSGVDVEGTLIDTILEEKVITSEVLDSIVTFHEVSFSDCTEECGVTTSSYYFSGDELPVGVVCGPPKPFDPGEEFRPYEHGVVFKPFDPGEFTFVWSFYICGLSLSVELLSFAIVRWRRRVEVFMKKLCIQKERCMR